MKHRVVEPSILIIMKGDILIIVNYFLKKHCVKSVFLYQFFIERISIKIPDYNRIIMIQLTL